MSSHRQQNVSRENLPGDLDGKTWRDYIGTLHLDKPGVNVL